MTYDEITQKGLWDPSPELGVVDRLISNNYTDGRGGYVPEFVVIHTYGAPGDDLYNWFNNPSAQVSAHYSVSKDGTIRRYLPESLTAWHAGVYDVNLKSIGIEHQDDGNYEDPVRTDALYERSSQIIADIYIRMGWDIENLGLIKKHNEFVARACPGGLSIDRIRNRVYEILHPEPEKPPIDDDKIKEAAEKLKEEYTKKVEEYKKMATDLEESQAKNTKLLKGLKEVAKNNVELRKEIAVAEAEVETVRNINITINNNGVNVLYKVVEESIDVEGILNKWKHFVDSTFKSNTLRSILKYDIFVLLGIVLPQIPIYLSGLNLPVEVVAGLSAVSGIGTKLLVTRYDTNEDGKLDKSDLKTL
jgi:hypothetical protein